MKRSLSLRRRATCRSTGQLIDVLVVFFGRSQLDMTVIDDEIQNAIKTSDPIPDSILLMSFGNRAKALAEVWCENTERVAGLIRRGRSATFDYLKDLTIWSFAAGTFDLLHRDSSSKVSYELDIPKLLADGLSWLVDEQRAFQVAPSGHVFRHPSMRQSRHFLLASELVKDEVDAYFVGLCVCAVAWARLSDVNTLHIDTMGIYPVARAIEDIAASSGGKFSGPWHIDSFHSHGGIDGLHTVISPGQAVLISASTTGSMAAKLAAGGVPEPGLITILDMSDHDRRGIIVYARERNSSLKGSSPAESADASAGETVIELTGEYFVATGKKPRALVLSKDHKPAPLQTLLAHFGDSVSCRLNGRRVGTSTIIDLVSLNENRIGADQRLRKWAAEEIRLKTPGSVSHVLPLAGPGSATLSSACADRIAEYTGRRPVIIEQSALPGLDVTTVSGVLVCAALVGNGHALRAASRDLRETIPNASRHFLVGVGLPNSEEAWTRLRQFLTQSGDISRPYLFSQWMVLPTGAESGRGEAWTRAAALMQRTEQLQAAAIGPWDADVVSTSLSQAGDMLDKADAGFLPDAAGAPLTLTRGFVFWSPELDVLAAADHAAASYLAIASALQNARESKDPARRLRSSLHETVVLDPENFQRFNDGVLQASLLRAAYAHELDYSAAPELSEVMREFLEKVFLNHSRSYGQAASEFAFALASGHLRLTAEDGRLLRDHVLCGVAAPCALLGLLYCTWAFIER